MGIQEMPMKDLADYEAEQALETLIQADRISSDEKLMGRVSIAADKKADDARRVARQYGNEPTPVDRHPDANREGKVDF